MLNFCRNDEIIIHGSTHENKNIKNLLIPNLCRLKSLRKKIEILAFDIEKLAQCKKLFNIAKNLKFASHFIKTTSVTGNY